MSAKRPSVTAVAVQPGSRLEQLLAQYDAVEAEASEAEARFETLKAAVKAELSTAAVEGATRIAVNAPTLRAPLQMAYVESWRIDAGRLKVEDPLTYVKWAKKSGHWELRRAKS